MTLAELNEICEKNNIKDDVILLSDSRWECCETKMDGVWYSEIDNMIVFTQEAGERKYNVTQRRNMLSPNQKLRRLK